jgi:transcription elongation GreA/GreB family factor
MDMEVSGRVTDPTEPTQGVGRQVGVGSKVRVFDGYGEVEFVIVPEDEARAAGERYISVSGPLGKSLRGRRAGDEVWVRTGAGFIHFVRIRHVG